MAEVKAVKEKVVPTTIGGILGLRTPEAWSSSKVVPLPNPAPGLLYGLELEIENIPYSGDPLPSVSGWYTEEDGSLRALPDTTSIEYISKPMTYSHVHFALTNLFQALKPNERNYTERCSIHVHTNVHNLTYEQLASLFLIYQVYERLLFHWIGNDRSKNIFCVPWYDTLITYQVVERIRNKRHSEWEKYTALNMLPIVEHSSIEWRHMEGNCDIPRIMRWLRFIGHIYKLATELSFDQIKSMFVNLNTTSQYNTSINQVFLEDAAYLKAPGYEQHIEDGVLSMKYSILNKTTPPNWFDIEEDRILAEMPVARQANRVNLEQLRADAAARDIRRARVHDPRPLTARMMDDIILTPAPPAAVFDNTVVMDFEEDTP